MGDRHWGAGPKRARHEIKLQVLIVHYIAHVLVRKVEEILVFLGENQWGNVLCSIFQSA